MTLNGRKLESLLFYKIPSKGLGSDAKLKSAVFALKTKGDVSDVVSVGDVKYVLKLDSVKTADLSKLLIRKLKS